MKTLSLHTLTRSLTLTLSLSIATATLNSNVTPYQHWLKYPEKCTSQRWINFVNNIRLIRQFESLTFSIGRANDDRPLKLQLFYNLFKCAVAFVHAFHSISFENCRFYFTILAINSTPIRVREHFVCIFSTINVAFIDFLVYSFHHKLDGILSFVPIARLPMRQKSCTWKREKKNFVQMCFANWNLYVTHFI